MEKLGQVDVENAQRQVVSISQDSFYKELTPAERAKAERGQYNFDHPGNLYPHDLLLCQFCLCVFCNQCIAFQVHSMKILFIRL